MAKRFKEKIVEAQVLYDNVAPRLTDLPQLADHHKALGTALAQARDLEGQQETAKGHLRDLNVRRQKQAEETADLRRRLTTGLQSALGPDNTALLELGIKPRRTTLRRRSLTPAEKAVRAAERAQRAAAKAAALAAKEPSIAPPPTAPAK